MIPEMTGRRVTYDPDGKLEVNDFTGYYLKVDEIVKICRDFACDFHGGFVSNDKAYIELKLKEM